MSNVHILTTDLAKRSFLAACRTRVDETRFEGCEK
jgi:hypothetical protein